MYTSEVCDVDTAASRSMYVCKDPPWLLTQTVTQFPRERERELDWDIGHYSLTSSNPFHCGVNHNTVYIRWFSLHLWNEAEHNNARHIVIVHYWTFAVFNITKFSHFCLYRWTSKVNILYEGKFYTEVREIAQICKFVCVFISIICFTYSSGDQTKFTFIIYQKLLSTKVRRTETINLRK